MLNYYTAEPLVEVATIDEVKKTILKLINNKQPGSDTIPAEYLKNRNRALPMALRKLIGEI